MPDLDQIKQAEQVHCRCRGECQSGGAEPARQRHAIPEPDRHFGDGSHDGNCVAEFIFDKGLAQVERPRDIRAWIEGQLYRSQY
jgi:hypothetical protein